MVVGRGGVKPESYADHVPATCARREGKGKGVGDYTGNRSGFAICSDVSRSGRHVEEGSKQVVRALRRWRVL